MVQLLAGRLGPYRLLDARSAEEYAGKILMLVESDAARQEISRRIRGLDLRARISDPDGPEHFKKAIDFLISQHDRLQGDRSRAPIFIR